MSPKARRQDPAGSRPSARKPPARAAAQARRPRAFAWLERLTPAQRLLLIFGLYLALRLLFLGTMAPLQCKDSPSYIDQYRGGFAEGFFGRARCWAYPLCLWLGGYHFGLVAAAQRLAGALAWFALAVAAGGSFRSAAARRVALWGVLLISLTLFSLIWDAMVLSESFSNSGFIALTAAWIWFLGSPGAGLRPLALLAALAIPFAGQRDSNAMLLVFVSAAVALTLALRFFHRPVSPAPGAARWAAWGLVGLILAVGLAQIAEMRRCGRNWQSVGAVLSIRVFMKDIDRHPYPNDERLDWVARRYGLPLEEARARVAKTVYQAPPISPAYVDWLKHTGPQALSGFMLHHPLWVLETFNHGFSYKDTQSGLLYLQPPGPWRRANLELPSALHAALHKALDPLFGVPWFNTLLSLAAAALGVGWLVRAWRGGFDGLTRALGVLFWLTAVSALTMFFTIFGDFFDAMRHAVTGFLALYTVLPILVATAIERFAGGQDRT